MTRNLRRACPLALAAVLVAISAQAALLAVNHADDVDDGECTLAHCSLREAMNASEALDGRDVIAFLIEPTDGRVHRIQPTSPLPPLSDAAGVEISGLSQPGSSSARTIPYSLAAVLKIEIDGAFAGAAADGLVVEGGSARIEGVAIHGFSGSGIRLAGGADHEIRNVFVGTDAAGLTAIPNAGDGVVVAVPGCAVRDSIFSANGGAGMRLIEAASATEISRNLVGGGANGMARLGNAGPGIVVMTADNQISATGPNGNLVRANGSVGIVLTGDGAHSNRVRQNWIDENQSHGILVTDGARDNTFVTALTTSGASNYLVSNGGNAIRIAASAGADNLALPFFVTANVGIPIDLEGGDEDESGSTRNDEGDVDEGPNDLLNVPTLLSARRCLRPPSSVPNVICVEVEYSGAPGQEIAPVFLTGLSCDALAGTGSILVLTTDSNGYARGSTVIDPARFPATLQPHEAIAVMAIDFPPRRSSEVSSCTTIEPATTGSPTASASTPTAPLPTGTATPTSVPPTGTATATAPLPTGSATPTRSTPSPSPSPRVDATATAPVASTPTATASGAAGDANCDGCVSAADMIDTAAQRAAGEVRCGADLAPDGEIDERDRAALARALFGPAASPCGS